MGFVDSKDKEVLLSEASKGKSVALYFAGEWCPMCTAFTPQLTDFLSKPLSLFGWLTTPNRP